MTSKQIGLFFGSFNPIHIGHLILANYFVEQTDLDEVWLVVSPQNPFKNKSTLAPEHQRLMMVNLALEEYPKLRSSDIEFKMPQPSYTVDTLTYLKEKFSDYAFALIMGRDNLTNFHKWKNYEEILKHHELLVYPRPDAKDPIESLKNHPKIIEINAPQIEISSTLIRKMISDGKNVRPLLPPEVFHFIDGSALYKK